MKFITITGIDKSGKSTLINALWNVLDKTHYVMDRDLSTWHFFNEMAGRVDGNRVYKKEYKNKLNIFRQLVDLAIILEVNEEDWSKRCLEHKEQPLYGNLSFKEHQKQINRYFTKAKYPNILRLNTSELSIDECLRLICKRLGKHYTGEYNAN